VQSIWDRAAAIMDRVVDGVVGDRVQYKHRGVWLGSGSPPVVEAFVLQFGSNPSIEDLDEPLGNRWRLKIARTLLDEPLQSDRFQHPKLGPGWFRPGDALPDNEGRYHIFDVQKASAP